MQLPNGSFSPPNDPFLLAVAWKSAKPAATPNFVASRPFESGKALLWFGESSFWRRDPEKLQDRVANHEYRITMETMHA